MISPKKQTALPPCGTGISTNSDQQSVDVSNLSTLDKNSPL